MSNRPWVNSNERIGPDDNLSDPFLKAVSPEQDFRVGVELEQFLVSRDSFEAVGYFDDSGIQTVLKAFQTKFDWNAVFENDNVIALNKDSLTITLEPGGALEFVSPPLENINQIDQVISSFEQELVEILKSSNLDALPLGYLPFDTLESVKLVPKSRYDFMYDYMPKVGSRGREMMKLTSSIQVAIDYSSEEDACRKMRLAALASPFFIALSSSSLIKGGKPDHLASQRADIWANTDPARSGVPSFQIKNDASFEDYVNWALKAPIYFIVRDGQNFPAGGISFSEFIEGKFDFGKIENDPYPVRADWEQHLSTLFPWIRLRHYVEVRSFDMGPPQAQRAATALVKGLFYSEKSMSGMDKILHFNDSRSLSELFSAVSQDGLDARLEGVPIRSVAEHLVNIAEDALIKADLGEERFLNYYKEKIEKWSKKSEIESASKDTKGYIASRSQRTLLNKLF